MWNDFLTLKYRLPGLLRALHSRNPAQVFAYREATASLLCSYWGVSQSHIPIIVRAQMWNDFLTLKYRLPGLLRALHSRNPPQVFAYREATASLLCSYWGVSQSHIPIIVRAQMWNDFDTL